MRSSIVLSFSFVVSSLVLGCIAEPGESAEDTQAASSGSAALGTTVEVLSWTSGKTDHLSSWKSLTCTETFGSNYFLRTLEVFREPWANADNFIARMEGQCAELTGLYTANTTGDNLVFSADHRSGGYRVDAFADWLNYNSPTGFWLTPPEGIDLVVNDGEGYVKNVRFGYHSWSAFEGTYRWAIDEGGYDGWPQVHLLCPEGQVVTGLKLRHDTRNGKIRDVKVFCRSRT